MGTGTDDSNLKEEAKKRSHMTARLYRGLLDILKTKNEHLSTALVAHIRSFDRGEESEFSYTEMMGFWRMLMELIFNVYVQTVHFVGVLLVATLVVVAWPLRCLIELFTGSWFGKNYQHQDELGQEPVFDKPEESKNVVRRVVYEEAKVEKK
jgi:hypothetical protein